MLLIPLAQQFLQSLGALNTRNQVIRNEVNIAPIAFRPGAFFREGAGEGSFIEGQPRDYRGFCLLTRREPLIFQTLIEDVVDNLHGTNPASPDCAQAIPWFPTIQTNADCLDKPLTAQIVNFVEPAIIA